VKLGSAVFTKKLMVSPRFTLVADGYPSISRFSAGFGIAHEGSPGFIFSRTMVFGVSPPPPPPLLPPPVELLAPPQLRKSAPAATTGNRRNSRLECLLII
jgi:hypothetical protein